MIKEPVHDGVIVRKTSKIGEPPPETPPGIVYIEAELIDDSSQLILQKARPQPETSK